MASGTRMPHRKTSLSRRDRPLQVLMPLFFGLLVFLLNSVDSIDRNLMLCCEGSAAIWQPHQHEIPSSSLLMLRLPIVPFAA